MSKAQRIEKGLSKVAVSADILQAYQYLYHVGKHSVISDEEYDAMKHEEEEFGTMHHWKYCGPRKKVVQYPPHIRDLASYIYTVFLGASDHTVLRPGSMFGLGERTDEPGVYKMWYGPVATVGEALDQLGRTKRSRVLKLSEDRKPKPLFKWRDGWREIGT